METKTELSTIFVEGRKIKIADKEILIKTISVGDLPVVLNLINKYLEVAPKLHKSNDKNSVIIKAIHDDYESALKLVQVTTDLTLEEINKLNIAALAIILTEVITENADFLHLHVVPAFQKVADNFNAKKKTDGLNKSKS